MVAVVPASGGVVPGVPATPLEGGGVATDPAAVGGVLASALGWSLPQPIAVVSVTHSSSAAGLIRSLTDARCSIIEAPF
jgi:hypothetical protein